MWEKILNIFAKGKNMDTDYFTDLTFLVFLVQQARDSLMDMLK